MAERSDESRPSGDGIRVRRTLTVRTTPAEAYRRWLEPDTLPRIMAHAFAVEWVAPDRTRWTLDLPKGPTWTWDGVTTEQEEGSFVRWASAEGADVPTTGEVRFRSPASEEGTEVTLDLWLDPPGLTGKLVEKVGLVPSTMAGKALRRFKSLVETGEIPTLLHNPSARGDDADDTSSPQDVTANRSVADVDLRDPTATPS